MKNILMTTKLDKKKNKNFENQSLINSSMPICWNFREKDFSFVESAFKRMKSDLDIRPVYVRSEE